MEIIDLITPQSIIPDLHVTSKKQVLQALSQRAAEIAQEHERTIFEVLLARERLGTTGVGAGVAIPHGTLPGLNRIFGVFARLDAPVDFEAVDEQPVDLLFLLLAPESAGADHLKAMLTGDGTHESASPYCAASWEGTDEDFTALVTDNGPQQLQVKLFSHGSTPAP